MMVKLRALDVSLCVFLLRVPVVLSVHVLAAMAITCPFLAVSAGANAVVTKEEKRQFDVLRKAVQSQPGGYVHPSLGIIAPAPSGAQRGLGIVKKYKKENNNDVLLKVPISYQMTRTLALSTLIPLIPADVLHRVPLNELDDAALLVLLVLHERGLGRRSSFKAYIDTLPDDAGCGWTGEGAEDFRKLPKEVEPEDIEAGMSYAYRVSTGMASDYGEYLSNDAWPREWKEDVSRGLQWSLCTVSSRGTAANSIPGNNEGGTGIRLVPVADLMNHDGLSAGFIELSSTEKVGNGDFVDAVQTDAGTFVVRSVWKDWRTKELDVGDEVTVSYNLPHYGAVDWYLSLGFVPGELSGKRSDEL
mmetsp:Transcript_37246/g.75867  ORF Transcript_37246/g.75867 Transcript_37246/m.75867 type:complete len:359 (+) Transcript_37246:70-1146(+)